MTAGASVVEVTLESTLNNIEVAEDVTRRVTATAGFDEENQHKIEMAVHESMINAVSHGNKNDPSKHVWLRFQIFDDRLEISVRDQGNGFDPANLPDPLATENLLNVSGRGLLLIRTFMDEFRVERIAGSGTVVTLVKRINDRTHPSQGGKNREHESHNTSS